MINESYSKLFSFQRTETGIKDKLLNGLPNRISPRVNAAINRTHPDGNEPAIDGIQQQHDDVLAKPESVDVRTILYLFSTSFRDGTSLSRNDA
ncbi:hypothetical protein GWI33_000755 [Rhynchophorus ferrugineus]|uniref:Uncharacterized protein n=1 Tax=Rhynchophorus ferrugineus TaxID=354439 RepID=A0A834HKV7_RHYFE|nr:hypothetical protein GWI33_000756 [Rhynchophorus ferrugineus]KAF7264021.1 hypothetical protein GWI33_000755 [Rhynchophorus ferrugineus]